MTNGEWRMTRKSMPHVGSDTQYGIRNTEYAPRTTHHAPRITGTTRLVGVIGWPVSHSRSPRMHNAAFAALGLDWAYVPLPVPPERVGDAVRGLVALGFAGANVTVPHKQAVIPFLDELTPVARAIGAVNTIVVRPDGSLLGDSTDGAGFMADLRAHGAWWVKGKGGSGSTDCLGDAPSRRSPHPRVPASPFTVPSSSARAVRHVLSCMPWQRRALRSPWSIARWPRHRNSVKPSALPCRFTAETPRARKDSVVLCDLSVSAVDSSFAWDAVGPLSAHPLPDALPVLAAGADLIVNTTSLGLHEGDPHALGCVGAIPAGPGRL